MISDIIYVYVMNVHLEPRLLSLFHQHNRKKKDGHEDKQVQGASFWVPFWHLRLVICGDGVAGPWFEANAVFLCDADALPQWNSVAEGASA